MTVKRQVRELASRAFRQKRARRRALAALSFSRKISLLVRLQHAASEVSRAYGKKRTSPWKIE